MGTQYRCKLTPATRSPSMFFCTLWPCDLDLWSLNPKTTTLVGYPKVIPYTKFEDFGITRFWVMLQTNTQNHAHTHATKRFTPTTAWVITALVKDTKSWNQKIKVQVWKLATRVRHITRCTHFTSQNWHLIGMRHGTTGHLLPAALVQ